MKDAAKQLDIDMEDAGDLVHEDGSGDLTEATAELLPKGKVPWAVAHGPRMAHLPGTAQQPRKVGPGALSSRGQPPGVPPGS